MILQLELRAVSAAVIHVQRVFSVLGCSKVWWHHLTLIQAQEFGVNGIPG